VALDVLLLMIFILGSVLAAGRIFPFSHALWVLPLGAACNGKGMAEDGRSPLEDCLLLSVGAHC
jgi:hypothetical protein